MKDAAEKYAELFYFSNSSTKPRSFQPHPILYKDLVRAYTLSLFQRVALQNSPHSEKNDA